MDSVILMVITFLVAVISWGALTYLWVIGEKDGA
jgi:hypothetical protein